MIVHPSFEAFFAVTGHRIGGHRQNWQLGETIVLADFARGSNAIHNRHLHIHQYRVVGALADHAHRLLAVFCQIDEQPTFLQ